MAIQTTFKSDYPIDEIVVDLDQRYRKPSEEAVNAMVASIEKYGLINPLTLKPDGQLVAGYTRYLAIVSLGWSTVPVTFKAANELQGLELELDENVVRTEMNPIEAAKLRNRINELRTDANPDKVHSNAPTGKTQAERRKNWAAESGAAASGVSRTTMDRVDEITRFAEDTTAPDSVRITANQVLAQIEEGTLRVEPALRQVVEAAEAEEAIERYPELASLQNTQAILNMSRSFDEVDETQREKEREEFKKVWAAGDTEILRLKEQHYLAFKELKASIEPALTGHALTLFAALLDAGAATTEDRSRWEELHNEYGRLSNQITSLLKRKE